MFDLLFRSLGRTSSLIHFGQANKLGPLSILKRNCFYINTKLAQHVIEQLEHMKVKLENKAIDHVSEWTNWKSNLIKARPSTLQINENNFEYQFICCIIQVNYKEPVILNSFRNYLHQTNIAKNVYLTPVYTLLLLYINDKQDEELIEKLIKIVINDNKLKNHSLREHCVNRYISSGLKQALYVLDIFCNNQNLIKYYSSFDTLFWSLINNNLVELAIKLLEKKNEEVESLKSETLINSLIESNHDEKLLIRVVNFLKLTRTVLEFDCKSQLLKLLKTKGYSVSENIVFKHGKCCTCNSQLSIMTQEDYIELRELAQKYLLDLELKMNDSMKNEVKTFQKFLNSSPPFNLIVDGLNQAHNCGPDKLRRSKNGSFKYTTSIFVQEKTLFQRLTQLKRTHNRILLIGRKHMLKWNNLNDFLKKNQIKMFLVNDNLQDDIFFIWAALQNINTCFATNDFLRQHFSKITEKISLVKKWYNCRHIPANKVNNLGLDNVVNISDASIHFPLRLSKSKIDDQVTWICATKQKHKKVMG